MLEVTVLEASHEPFLALLGCAVGKAIWNGGPVSSFLQGVVTNSVGSIHGLFDIADF